jgi:hypothetical protein
LGDSIELEPDKMKSLRAILEGLSLDYENVFTDSFMSEHTSFSSIQEMFEAGDWMNGRGSLDHQVNVGQADELTEEETDFDTWHQMMNAALDAYWDSPRQNRRRHERHPCKTKVTIDTGTEEFEGIMVDLSKSGFRLQTNHELPNTQIIKVRVPESESDFSGDLIFRGAVRWQEESAPSQLGVEILSKDTYG